MLSELMSDFSKLLFINSSIFSSVSSDNLLPSLSNIFSPLSSNLLCEAVIIIPRSALIDLVNIATAGVGMGPKRKTSIPIDNRPDVTACSIIYPESLVSLPITTLCL